MITTMLKNTDFGWFIAERNITCQTNYLHNNIKRNSVPCFTTQLLLENTIENFWKIEEVPQDVTTSVESSRLFAIQ